jgi:hypothetical protein
MHMIVKSTKSIERLHEHIICMPGISPKSYKIRRAAAGIISLGTLEESFRAKKQMS